MPHFFIDSNNVTGNTVTICDKDNYNHIVKSLRANLGENLLVIDENSVQYETVIKEITQCSIVADISNQYQSARKLDFELYLLVYC